MIVGNPIIMILKAILNWFRLRRDYIANAVDKIPPEIKDALIAWYSPCKQKLTNYDVIESYAEDFTSNNWKHKNSVTVTNNSFHLTYGDLRYELYPNSTYNTKPMTVIVKGMAGIIGFIRYRYGANKNYVDINKDGVYYLPAKIDDVTVLGFQTHFKSECNITITQLPTSILKDFSGNGNHAYLYGGKGKLNSGMGVYNEDFTTYTVQFDNNKPYEQYYNKVIIHNSDNYISNFWKNINKPPLGQTEYSGFKLKISGLPKNSKVNIRVYYGDDYSQIKTIEAITDEIVVIPKTTANVITANKTFTYIDFNLTRYKNTITIEQIPDYPDQLCYDGKMYAVCYGFPILTDYTVMAERTWFKKEGAFIVKGSSPNYGFVFERFDGDLERVQSLGTWNTITINTDSTVSYLTKNKYNDSNIKNGIGVDDNILSIGAAYNKVTNIANLYFTGCHSDILLFNRTLTDDELDLVKKHFFGIVRIKDALMTTDKKYLALANNNVTQFNNIKRQ